MSSAAANVREELLSRWYPGINTLPEDEGANALRLWHELTVVASAGAWRSTSLLAGQLAEAFLRSKLVGVGLRRWEVQRLRTFNLVIRKARQLNLLRSHAGPASDLVGSAIRLRNESSHFSLWAPYTSEYEASWALAVASLIVTELGFGTTDDTDGASSRWLETQVKALDPEASSPSVTIGDSPSVSIGLTASPPPLPASAKKGAYSLVDVRAAILSGWRPPTSKFSADEQSAVGALFSEITLTADHAASRGLASLSGQIVEAYLRHKLVDAGREGRTVIERMNLKALIRLCDEEDMFDRPFARSTTGADAVHSAEILRNWASHYALWLPYTDELRATQALAMAVSVLESLYPEAMPVFSRPPLPVSSTWVTANWKSVAPGMVLRLVGRMPIPPPPFNSPTREVFDHVLRGAFSTFHKLVEWSRGTTFSRDDLRAAVNARFPDLVRKAHREGLKRLMDAVFDMNGLFVTAESDELAPQALLLGALLPIGVESLREVFTLPTSRIPIYLALARRCGDNLLAQSLRCTQRPCAGEACSSDRCTKLIPAFWEEFNPIRNENPLNLANAFLQMPDDVKVDFLARIPAQFLEDGAARPFHEWLTGNLARNGVNILSSLKESVLRLDKSGQLGRFRQDTVAALVAAVSKDPLEELSAIPHRLYRLRLREDDGAKIVLEAVLARTGARDVPGNNTRRIVWDTYQYFPSLALGAVKAAERVLEGDLVPDWDVACIAGVLEVDSPGCCAGRWSRLHWNEVEGQAKLKANVDRWQKLLVLLAVFRRAAALGGPVPQVFYRTSENLLRDLKTDAAPTASLKLVAQLRAELQGRHER